ncbi:MAG: BON domain-containing protein [Pirellulales bacterium]|jgi:osmotically-inducible protein OsmY
MPEMMMISAEQEDGELERRLISFLTERQIPSLRRVSVAVKNGIVTLSGQVRSFYERQLCLACCQRVAGVRQLVDQIEVGVR